MCGTSAGRSAAQEPGTLPIAGGVGAFDSTASPSVASQILAHEPSSWILVSQSLMNDLNCASSFFRPMP